MMAEMAEPRLRPQDMVAKVMLIANMGMFAMGMGVVWVEPRLRPQDMVA
jgi:hypothetical protein